MEHPMGAPWKPTGRVVGVQSVGERVRYSSHPQRFLYNKPFPVAIQVHHNTPWAERRARRAVLAPGAKAHQG